jgi:5-methylcytosine-specific restriction protein B
MTTPNLESPSADAISILRLLKDQHNVLLSGPPATGKSRLLAEVLLWFKGSTVLAFSPSGPNAFPANVSMPGIDDWLPSPAKDNRQTWEITFHQNTKHRDFVGGFRPSVGGDGFQISRGPLFLSAAHARTEDGTSLLIIDEINRGPAVAVFGDAITAMEPDKRLLPDNSPGPMSRTLQTVGDDGSPMEFYLPHHLYILAAMNEADTSIEPLDVAFRRRFEPYRLEPDEAILRTYLGIPAPVAPDQLPATATTPEEVFQALVISWKRVNGLIGLARGNEFRIGHGLFMKEDSIPNSLDAALIYAARAWKRLHAHLGEVFFGDTRGLAEVLRAGQGANPYQLFDGYFNDTPVSRLDGPINIGSESIYVLLRILAQ